MRSLNPRLLNPKPSTRTLNRDCCPGSDEQESEETTSNEVASTRVSFDPLGLRVSGLGFRVWGFGFRV